MFHRLQTSDYSNLVEAFHGIPNTVTTLRLAGNSLHRKTEYELTQAFEALPTLVGLSKKKAQAGKFLRPVPQTAIEEIASFLLPKEISFAKIHGLFSSPSVSAVMNRASENDGRVAGRPHSA